MAARGRGQFLLYIYIEIFKNLLYTSFNSQPVERLRAIMALLFKKWLKWKKAWTMIKRFECLFSKLIVEKKKKLKEKKNAVI